MPNVDDMEPLRFFENRGIPRSVEVLADASAVLQDLRWAALHGRPGLIGVLAAMAGLVMTSEGVAEVERGIERVGASASLVEAMRLVWVGTYRGHVQVGTVEDKTADARVAHVAQRDPDDVALAALAVGCRRSVLLSSDLDLIEAGLAHESWLSAARVVERLNHLDAGVAGTAFAAEMTVRAITGLVAAASRGSAPARLILLVAALAVSVWFSDPERRAAALEGVRAVGSAAMDAVVERQCLTDQLLSRPAVGQPRAE